MNRIFGAIVIGAGQAGPPLAARLTAAGISVAVIERHLFGGTCVNTGCMPTKTMVASAAAAHVARRARDFGVRIAGEITVSLPRVKARADKVSADARFGVEGFLRNMIDCSVFVGQARFLNDHEVEVGDDTLSAERIFINVGGRANRPDISGIDQVDILNNSSILTLESLPEHLVVVGGSYIGLEFAQMYRRFGSRVTVVEKGERLMGREDPDVSAAIKGILEAEGIAFRLGAECIHFAPDPKGIRVGVACVAGEQGIVGTHVLLAVGRMPNTADLGLAAAGVATDGHGYIAVDNGLATNVPGIWALGDCNGRGAFTHTAYDDFQIVAANLLDGAARRLSGRIPAYALYIDPPLGRVGMTETEARASGRKILVGRRPMTQVGRAVEKDETQGLMKIIADAGSREILGAAILGPGGDEAIHAVVDMMTAGAPYPVLQGAMHIHPTVSELIPTIAQALAPNG